MSRALQCLNDQIELLTLHGSYRTAQKHELRAGIRILCPVLFVLGYPGATPVRRSMIMVSGLVTDSIAFLQPPKDRPEQQVHELHTNSQLRYCQSQLLSSLEII